MQARLITLLAITSFVAAPASLSAHHGTAGYDTTKLVTVQGVVTEFHFSNPHVEIALDVKKDDGSVESWQGEMNSPNIIARAAGWNGKTLKPGDNVVLVGYQAKRDVKVLRLEKVSLSNGTELFPKGETAWRDTNNSFAALLLEKIEPHNTPQGG